MSLFLRIFVLFLFISDNVQWVSSKNEKKPSATIKSKVNLIHETSMRQDLPELVLENLGVSINEITIAIMESICEALKEHVTTNTNLVHHACHLALEIVKKWLSTPTITTMAPVNITANSQTLVN